MDRQPSVITNRPLNWNGVSVITDHLTGDTVGWTKRKSGNAGRSSFNAYLNTQGTFRDAEYLGTTATSLAAEKKVRWHWGNRETEVLS